MELAPGVKIANPLVAVADETDGREPDGEVPTDLLCEVRSCEERS